MSTKTTSPKVNEKIATYFEKQIDFKDFAQQIRRANYIIAQVMMRPDAEQNVTKSYWAEDCVYHLNEFAELIDPLLEKE